MVEDNRRRPCVTDRRHAIPTHVEAVEPAAAGSVMNIAGVSHAQELLGYEPRFRFEMGRPEDDRVDRRAEGGL